MLNRFDLAFHLLALGLLLTVCLASAGERITGITDHHQFLYVQLFTRVSGIHSPFYSHQGFSHSVRLHEGKRAGTEQKPDATGFYTDRVGSA